MAQLNVKKELVPALLKAGITATSWEKSGSGHWKVFTQFGDVSSWVEVSSSPRGSKKIAVHKMVRDAKSMLRDKGANL